MDRQLIFIKAAKDFVDRDYKSICKENTMKKAVIPTHSRKSMDVIFTSPKA